MNNVGVGGQPTGSAENPQELLTSPNPNYEQPSVVKASLTQLMSTYFIRCNMKRVLTTKQATKEETLIRKETRLRHCTVFIEQNLCVNRPAQLAPVLLKTEMQYHCQGLGSPGVMSTVWLTQLLPLWTQVGRSEGCSPRPLGLGVP